MKRYKFSIFTPCFNGAKTIHRVFESLKKSTYRNFEWIIVNDGSGDNSGDVIISLLNSVDWDITYINWEKNRGKHIAWNEAAKIAKGEIFITIDCDDAFVPQALSFFNKKWNLFYNDKSISGINVLCEDAITEEISGTKFPYDGIRSNYRDLYSIYNTRGDKWESYRTEYIKMFPFPTIPANYYTECFLHYLFSENYSTINYNIVLRKYYCEHNSLTHTKVEKINNLYMIIHYQRWHIPKEFFYLLRNNSRELARCIKELVITTIKYKIMSWLKIAEVKYLSD